jgi:menaquinone-dependent protoporphyrinogen oxidase
MSRILVLYGTSEGHTEKIATVIANTLIGRGIDADVIKAGTIDPSFEIYDGVIVAASVHRGRLQDRVVASVRAHAADIAARPNALVQVSLAVLRKTDPKVPGYLDAIVSRFSTDTGWKPSIVKHVAGALPYSRYNILTRWMMRWIVSRSGGDTDTSRDYVYTDWDDVKAFATEFGGRFRTAAA